MAGNNRRAGRVNEVQILSDPDRPMGPELPELRPDTWEEWGARARNMYENFRTSPLAMRMGCAPDWDFLMETVLLEDDFWKARKGRAILAAELRQRWAMLGVTPEARVRLKFDTPQPDDLSVGAAGGVGANVVRMEDFWERRGALSR